MNYLNEIVNRASDKSSAHSRSREGYESRDFTGQNCALLCCLLCSVVFYGFSVSNSSSVLNERCVIRYKYFECFSIP